jgi:BTB/POZ domain-containing protein 3/6
VFYAMLYGGLSCADTTKDVIEVPDVEPVAFLTMLNYLYCDEINLTPDNVLATLYCAKKYIVPHLVIFLRLCIHKKI